MMQGKRPENIAAHFYLHGLGQPKHPAVKRLGASTAHGRNSPSSPCDAEPTNSPSNSCYKDISAVMAGIGLSPSFGLPALPLVNCPIAPTNYARLSGTACTLLYNTVTPRVFERNKLACTRPIAPDFNAAVQLPNDADVDVPGQHLTHTTTNPCSPRTLLHLPSAHACCTCLRHCKQLLCGCPDVELTASPCRLSLHGLLSRACLSGPPWCSGCS
jgi:hypothetical protein